MVLPVSKSYYSCWIERMLIVLLAIIGLARLAYCEKCNSACTIQSPGNNIRLEWTLNVGPINRSRSMVLFQPASLQTTVPANGVIGLGYIDLNNLTASHEGNYSFIFDGDNYGSICVIIRGRAELNDGCNTVTDYTVIAGQSLTINNFVRNVGGGPSGCIEEGMLFMRDPTDTDIYNFTHNATENSLEIRDITLSGLYRLSFTTDSRSCQSTFNIAVIPPTTSQPEVTSMADSTTTQEEDASNDSTTVQTTTSPKANEPPTGSDSLVIILPAVVGFVVVGTVLLSLTVLVYVTTKSHKPKHESVRVFTSSISDLSDNISVTTCSEFDLASSLDSDIVFV